MVTEQVLTCNTGLSYSLKETINRWIDPYAYGAQLDLFRPPVTKQLRKGFSMSGGPFKLEEVFYGALDAFYTYHLFYNQLKRIDLQELKETVDLENKFALVVAEMELAGIPFDPEKWTENASQSSEKMKAILEELNQTAQINWNSWSQVNKVFKSLGINTEFFDKKTGELKESVSANALKNQTHPIVGKYLEYKEWFKLSSSYGVAFLKKVNSKTKRIHSSYNQIMSSGRTSSSNPNLQQIPRIPEFRECFRAPEGYVFVTADFSNQEVRLAADKSGEQKMIDAFLNKEDLHLKTASLIFEEEITDKEDPRRQIGKTVLFTIIYGGGPHKIADQFKLPIKEAKRVVASFKEAYPNLIAYIQNSGESTERNGYITINDYTSRKSYVRNFDRFNLLKEHIEYFSARGWEVEPKVVKEYQTIKSTLARRSGNYPIQGSGADMSKTAAVLLSQSKEKNKFQIVLFVHDEFVLLCKEEDASLVSTILEEAMLEASKKFLRKLTAPAKAVVSKTWSK